MLKYVAFRRGLLLMALCMAAAGLCLGCGGDGPAGKSRRESGAPASSNKVKIRHDVGDGEKFKVTFEIGGEIRRYDGKKESIPLERHVSALITSDTTLPNGIRVFTVQTQGGSGLSPREVHLKRKWLVTADPGAHQVIWREVDHVGGSPTAQDPICGGSGLMLFAPVPRSTMNVGDSIDLGSVLGWQDMRALFPSFPLGVEDEEVTLRGTWTLAAVKSVAGTTVAEFTLRLELRAGSETAVDDGREGAIYVRVDVRGTELIDARTGLPTGTSETQAEFSSLYVVGGDKQGIRGKVRFKLQVSSL